MTTLDRHTMAGAAVAVVVAAAIIGGIMMLGSPAQARLERLDERRVEDLGALSGAIDFYWTRRGGLPTALDSLRLEPGAAAAPMRDPGTGAWYEYQPVSAREYEVCASFDRPSPPRTDDRADLFWSHGVGRQCFRREVRVVR